jgi:hypothetical protein
VVAMLAEDNRPPAHLGVTHWSAWLLAEHQSGTSLPGMIDLPFWSSLTSESDTLPPSAGHDQDFDVPSLTSAETDGRTPMITRLPASGL